MQLILVGAAVASMAIGEVSTGIVVLLITVVNAVGGLRQQGKAESAMNALQSMLKTTARVRRDGTESTIPADQVVVGDVVLLTAGDDVCADGRIVQASSLQIDESAITGESVPASKSAETVPGDDVVLGDQGDMAFMNTPVTHGNGVMIVTGTGADTAVGRISGMLKSTPSLKTPLTGQLDTLTLWIAGAAGLTIVIMLALGAARGNSFQTIFTTAIALALAAVPMAMPTVLQVIMSSGSTRLAAQNAIVKSLDSVETLGSTSAINSDKTGTLTMNQVTVVEVIDPTDRYSITGIGYGLEGAVQHAAGSGDTLDAAILPFVIANDAVLADGKVVGDPTEGAMLVAAHKAGSAYRRDPRGVSAAGRPALRPDLQADGRLLQGHRRFRGSGRAGIRQGGWAGSALPGVARLGQRQIVPWTEEATTKSNEQMAAPGRQWPSR